MYMTICASLFLKLGCQLISPVRHAGSAHTRTSRRKLRKG